MKKFKSSVDIDGALTVGGQPVVGGGGAGAIATTIIDAKGDLIVGSAVDTAARLAAGTNGQVLSADSAEATGLKWVDANFSGGGGGTTSGAKMSKSQTQSYPYATNTAVEFDSVAWQHGDVVADPASDRITVSSSGLYLASAYTEHQNSSGAETDYMGFAVNGASNWDFYNESVERTKVDASQALHGSTPFYLSAGDYVQTVVFGTANTLKAIGWFSLIKIGASEAVASPNLLHNPAFEIWQRGTGSASCPADTRTFLADRWFVRPSGAAVTQQQSSSVPVGSYARFSLQVDGAASVTTVDLAQRVEAANIPALARTVTFSWRVYNGTGSSVTPSLLIGTPAASDVFTTVTNRLTQSLQACADAAWTTVSHTVDVSSYTNLSNGMEIALQFPSGSVVAGDVVRITEAQVTATSGVVGFNRPGKRLELEECWRYYYRNLSNIYSPCTNGGYGNSYAASVTYPVRMFAATPILTIYPGLDQVGTAGLATWHSGGSPVEAAAFQERNTAGGHTIMRSGVNTSTIVTYSFTADAEIWQ